MLGLGDGKSGEGQNSLKMIIFYFSSKDSTSLYELSVQRNCTVLYFSPLYTFLYPLYLVSRCSLELQRFLSNSREITDDFESIFVT